MKKAVLLFIAAGLVFSLASCRPSDKKEFEKLKESVADAGYDVSDVYVDSGFEGVVSSFSVRINFDGNTFAEIPIVLCESEDAVKKNSELFGADSIKLVIAKGKIFSYPGRDYPEKVLDTVRAIVNGTEIPKK